MGPWTKGDEGWRSVVTVAEKSLPRIVDVEAVAALLDPDLDRHTPNCIFVYCSHAVQAWVLLCTTVRPRDIRQSNEENEASPGAQVESCHKHRCKPEKRVSCDENTLQRRNTAMLSS